MIFVAMLSSQDEEEFPGLTPSQTVTDKLITSSYAAKLCNEVHIHSSVSAQLFLCYNYNTCVET